MENFTGLMIHFTGAIGIVTMALCGYNIQKYPLRCGFILYFVGMFLGIIYGIELF